MLIRQGKNKMHISKVMKSRGKQEEYLKKW